MSPLDQRLHDLAMTLRQIGRAQIGRILGSVPNTLGAYKALIDLFERSYFVRAENNAVARVLIEKGILTQEEWGRIVAEEYEHLAKSMAQQWPEMKFTPTGYTIVDVEGLQRRSRDEGWPP